MPIQIQGTDYDLPGENGLEDFTGDELDAIERQFAVDALSLLGDDEFDPAAGLTKTRWLYALAWTAKRRAGDTRTIAEFMTTPITAIKLPQAQENPTDATSSVAE